MDLRFDIRRAGCSGIGSQVVRFRGCLLAADECVRVYLTPGSRLVFYAAPGPDRPGRCWHFASLEEAAAALREGGGPLFGRGLLEQAAAGLRGDQAAG